MKEPFLEPILRKMRINRVLPAIKKIPNCRLLDIGCGWEARFLKDISPHISKGVGIDFKAPLIDDGKIKTFSCRIDDKLPFEDNSFDVVTMLAVLEHLDKPVEIMKDIHRVISEGGNLIVTVPSRAAKPVLEFLSFRLGIIDPEEMRDHKKYYNKSDLAELFSQTGFVIEEHRYFQLGMNNFCVGKPMNLMYYAV